MQKAQIIIVDFGSQYTHLIARRIRQLGVLATIHPANLPTAALRKVKGIILSGGPQSVYGKQAVDYNKKIFEQPIPILGICYGHQLLIHHYGGQVKSGKTKEYGFAKLSVDKKFGLLRGVLGRSTTHTSTPFFFKTPGRDPCSSRGSLCASLFRVDESPIRMWKRENLP